MQSIPDDISFFNQMRNQKPDPSGHYRCPVSLTPFVQDLIPTAYEEEFEFVIMGAHFEPEVATVNCMVFFKTPEGDVLKFGIADLNVRPDGFDLGDLKLYLAEEVSIALGNGEVLNLSKSSPDDPERSSYLHYSCDGFQAFHLNGIYTFDKSVLVSAENIANPVEAFMNIETAVWGDYLGTLKMAPFTIPGLEDWSFEALEAGADFSDFSNLLSMQFPKGFSPANPAWKGVYVNRMLVHMPDELKFGGKNAISFESEGLLIDRYGVSGILDGFEIYTPAKIEKNKWAMTVSDIQLQLRKNTMADITINGVMLSPHFTPEIKYVGQLYKERFTKDDANGFYVFDLSPVWLGFNRHSGLEMESPLGPMISLRKRQRTNQEGKVLLKEGEPVFAYKAFGLPNAYTLIELPDGVFASAWLKYQFGGTSLVLNATGILNWKSTSDLNYVEFNMEVPDKKDVLIEKKYPFMSIRQFIPPEIR